MQAKRKQEADDLKEDEEIPEEPKKRGIFSKAADVFTKKTISESKFEDLFYELEITLLENNVAVEVIDKIKKREPPLMAVRAF